MARWKPTPKADRFGIKRYDHATGDWIECEFSDLKRGDIYTAFGRDGAPLDAITAEPPEDDEVVFRCLGDAERNEAMGQGYQVEVLAGRLEDHLRGAAN